MPLQKLKNGGTVRYNEANKHRPEEHYHLIYGNPNEDLLIIVDLSLELSSDNFDENISDKADDDDEDSKDEED